MKLKIAAIAAIVLGFCPTAHGQNIQLAVNWHLTGVAERQGDWIGARNEYKHVLEQSLTLSLNIREWFIGTAYYGIARCSARLRETEEARRNLALAYSHHFWNTSLIELDSSLVSACGKSWIDSLGNFWSQVARDESGTLPPQEPIVYAPDSIRPGEKLPILIALHGGNGSYESFAQSWRNMPNAHRVIVVVPPGVYRTSDITNSWESDFNLIGNYLGAMLPRLYAIPHADSTNVYLTGFSQGAQASIELTLRHPDLYRGAIAFAGFTPCNWSDSLLDVAKSHHISIYAVSGDWEEPTFFAQLKNGQAICSAKGIPFIVGVETGMIHEVPLDLPLRFSEAWSWIRNTDQAATQKSRP